jgi:hypothetical protein
MQARERATARFWPGATPLSNMVQDKKKRYGPIIDEFHMVDFSRVSFFTVYSLAGKL